MANNGSKLSQEDKAQRIYQALNDYYNLFPDRQSAPSIVVTQDWEVFLGYEGEPCDSDYNDYAVMFMEDYEAEEWVYTLDTIRKCIPRIDEELEAARKFCLEMYGEVPTHENNLSSDLTYFIFHISLCIKMAIKENKMNEWIIEIDMPTSEVYLVNKKMRSPSYGGLIIHYDPRKLIQVTELGEKIVDKVKVRELAERICQDNLTGEFPNDDEGGELFRSNG